MQPRKDDMTHASIRPVALRMIVGAAAVIAALLAFVPAADAARDPISGGTTDLHLKKGFMKKLTNLGIGLAGIGTGQVSGSAIKLPVTEGMFDPTTAQGHITSPGGFQLVLGRRTVPISDVEANTVHGFVRANIAGAHMQLGTFVNPTTSREGFGARVKASQLTLTPKAARRISNQLGLKGARRIPSRVMSNEFNLTVPSTLTILGQNEATLEVGANVIKKLGEKGVPPSGINPIAPAKQPKAANFSFPITGGSVTSDGTTGQVTTTGGVEILKKGKTSSPQLKLTNVILELQQQKTATAELEILPAPGQTGRTPIVELAFPANSIQTNPTLRQITIQKAEAKLQPGAATTLNSVLNQGNEKAPPASSEFAAGEPFGTFSLTLQAQ